MLTAQTMRRLFWLAESVLLTAAVVTAVLVSQSPEWRSLLVVGLLLSLVLIGQQLHVTLRNQQVTPAFLALVLAMSLLGPVPAMCFGIAAMVLTSTLRRISLSAWLNN